MNKQLIEELRQKLEQKKIDIEKELEKIAKRDEKVPGDWNAHFPHGGEGESGSSALEREADEVEEYGALLSIEHNLEIRLKDINAALEKVEMGKYGLCENCGKPIPIERLEVFPEARLCINCEKK